MSPIKRTPEAELGGFIAKYSPEISSLAELAFAKMRQRYPQAVVLIYNNYNALVIGFGPTEKPSEAIFSVVLFPKWVSLFFLQAKGLADPDKILREAAVLRGTSSWHRPER